MSTEMHCARRPTYQRPTTFRRPTPCVKKETPPPPAQTLPDTTRSTITHDRTQKTAIIDQHLLSLDQPHHLLLQTVRRRKRVGFLHLTETTSNRRTTTTTSRSKTQTSILSTGSMSCKKFLPAASQTSARLSSRRREGTDPTRPST